MEIRVCANNYCTAYHLQKNVPVHQQPRGLKKDLVHMVVYLVLTSMEQKKSYLLDLVALSMFERLT